MHLLKGIVDDLMRDESTSAKIHTKNENINKVLTKHMGGLNKLQLSWLSILALGNNLAGSQRIRLTTPEYKYFYFCSL
jgi:hypothetical protein